MEKIMREQFLRELVELCNKHKFVIGGCGCCGSPWVEPLDPGEKITRYHIGDGKFDKLECDTVKEGEDADVPKHNLG